MQYLPEDLEESTIGKRSPGDIGYTVPWAMFVDKNRRLYINSEYTVLDRPFGTAHMRVRMCTLGIVEVARDTIGDHRYSLGAGENWLNVGLPVDLVSYIKEK